MAKRAGAKAAPGYGKGKTDDDNLTTLVQYYEDAEEISTDSRKLSERDRDYYDNKQLTAAELSALKKRGQPDIIINRIQTKVNYLLGYEASQRTDPRAFPRTPQDEDASAAVTDSLNYVREKTQLAQTFSLAWENMLVEGFAGIEVGVVPNGNGDAEITITQWDWDRLFADPHSRKHDYSDARYIGGVIWMDEDEAKQQWPDGSDVIGRTVTEEASKTYSDRPSWKQWAQPGSRKRVRVVQMYHKENGAWMWCIFTKSGKLASGEVPFKDEDDKSLCPMILQSAFVNRDNERYGFVRALIGPQDEINKRRSKSLHMLMGRPIKMEAGAVEDINEVRIELAKANGVIEVNPGMMFEQIDNSQELQGHLGLLQEAKNEIDQLGPNASMQGKGDRSASGRAIMANQQGGQIEIYRLVDRHAHMKLRVYKLIWSIVRQYWTAEKWIRVTDDEKNARFVGLNRPITLMDQLMKQAEQEGVDPAEAKQIIEERAKSDPMVAQQLQQVVGKENVPAEMEMDIILEEVPDSANVQQEQFEILAKLATSGVVFPPEFYVEMSALRNKKRLLEKLEQLKAPNPGKEQAEQIELAAMQAKLDKTLAEIEKLKADAVAALAKADSLDAQIGQIIRPQIIDYGQPQQQGNVQPDQQQPPDDQSAPPLGNDWQSWPQGGGMMGQGFPADGGYPSGFDPSNIPGSVPVTPDLNDYMGQR